MFKVDQAAQDVIRPSRWQGTNDYSLDARFAWDNRYLYLSYDVNDDVPRANTDVPNTSWNGDGAEVYIGFDQSKPGRSAYLLDTDFQITMSAGPNPTWAIFQGGAVLWSPEDGGPFQPADNIAVKDRAKGYILEARIPWAMLVGPNGITNKPPVPGQLIGFNVFANDGDNPDAPAQEKAMGFTGRPQAYLNPGAWATVQMDPPTPTVRPTLAIARQTDGKLRLGWPTQASGFALQQAATVLGPWTAVATQVAVQGDQNYVLIQPQASPAFYRLSQ